MKKRKFFRLLWAVFVAMMLLPLGTTAQSGRCLVVHTSDIDDGNSWDYDFWVNTNVEIKAGDHWELSMMIKADREVTDGVMTMFQKQALGGFDGYPPVIPFSTDWMPFHAEGDYEHPNDATRTAQYIELILGSFPYANTYYFDNISVKINGTETIVNGDFEGDDYSSFLIKEDRWGEAENVTSANILGIDRPKPYVILADNTITFYYDGNMPDGAYELQQSYNWDTPWAWGEYETVVFDESFKDYRPTSTACWFCGLYCLKEIRGIENLNTEKVTDMQFMYHSCYLLQSLDLSGWDVSNVTNMGSMFYGCSKLESLDLSGWDVRNVTNMGSMFYACSKLESLDLSGWDVRNVTNMEYMFGDNTSLHTIYVGDNWNLSDNLNSNDMFAKCPSLYGEQGSMPDSYEVYDASYTRIDGGDNAPGYFTKKGNSKATVASIDFNVKPYTEHILGEPLNRQDAILNVNFENREAQHLPYATNINVTTKGYDSTKVGTQTVTVNFLNASTTYEVNVTAKDTSYAYLNDNGVLVLYYGEYQQGALLVGNGNLFSNLSAVNKVVIDKSFAGCRPVSCAAWFCNFSNMEEIEGLENINTQYVTDMRQMFENCNSIETLDISSFNTANVTDMVEMFFCCKKLKTIYVGDKWNTDAVTHFDNMFAGSYALVGGQGTKYNFAAVNAACAHIDGGEDNPGYFTRKNVIVINNEQPSEIVAEFFDNGVEAVVESPTKVDKVEVLREFEKDKSSTIILPLDMDVADAAHGVTNMDGYEFYEFTGVEKVNGKWEATYKQVEKIEANKPYIVKNTGDKDLVFDNGNEQIDLKPVGKDETTITEGTDGTSAEGWEFVGTYEKKVWDADSPNEFGFAANDEGDDIKAGDFVRIGAGASIKPMRSYLRYTKDDNPFSKAGEQLPDKIGVVLIPLGSVVNPDDPNNDPNNGDIETPVSEIVPATNNDAKVWSYDKTIVIEAAPSTAYQVIDLGGRTLKNGVTNSSREEIVLGGKTDGMVIVMIGGKSFKIKY